MDWIHCRVSYRAIFEYRHCCFPLDWYRICLERADLSGWPVGKPPNDPRNTNVDEIVALSVYKSVEKWVYPGHPVPSLIITPFHKRLLSKSRAFDFFFTKCHCSSSSTTEADWMFDAASGSPCAYCLTHRRTEVGEIFSNRPICRKLTPLQYRRITRTFFFAKSRLCLVMKW